MPHQNHDLMGFRLSNAKKTTLKSSKYSEDVGGVDCNGKH